MYSFSGQIVQKGYEMNRAKISAYFISALFPAAVLYLCWWLSEAVGELIAGIAFVILCVNYFLIMRKFKKSAE